MLFLETLENKHLFEEKSPTRRFKTNEGVIEIWWENDIVMIYYVEVFTHLRRQGILTNFINYILINSNVSKLYFLGVESFALIKLLKRLGFTNKGGDFYQFKIKHPHKLPNNNKKPILQYML